jgi:hypothetical protein
MQTRIRARAPTVAAFALSASFALAQKNDPAKGPAKNPDAPHGQVQTVDELGLAFTLPAELTELKDRPTGNQVKLAWGAKLGSASLRAALYALPLSEFDYDEPEDVTDNIREHFRAHYDKTFGYAHTELCNGAFGYAPYGAIGWGPTQDKDGGEVNGTYCVLGGLLEQHGYALEIVANPALDAASEKLVLDFLRKGVVYQGKTRNATWTDEEAKARWMKDAPESTHAKFVKPIRSKHYIVLSNTGAAKQMSEAMEACYAQIQKTYPFPEVAGRRLMPIFLFRDPEEYYQFFAKQFETTVEQARKSKGVASRDFYATYYDAPGDPVHIHEATHQIFRNRLRLGGAGSWFQEGVAEYISTRPPDRVGAVNAVKKDKHTHLAEFVQIPSLLMSAKESVKGDNEGASHYALAALLIEFVRESKWSKDHFLDWVHAVGNTPPNNVAAIERATQTTLGIDLAGLEKKWIEYCKTR